MNKEHVQGATDTVVGKTMEAAGHVTGNKKLETEGKVDQVEGAAHNAAGDAKEAGKKAIHAVKARPASIKNAARAAWGRSSLMMDGSSLYLTKPLGQQDNRLEDGSTMNSTSLLGLFVATVTWIPIRTHPITERSGVLENKMTPWTAHTELHIPLH